MLILHHRTIVSSKTKKKKKGGEEKRMIKKKTVINYLSLSAPECKGRNNVDDNRKAQYSSDRQTYGYCNGQTGVGR